LGIVSRLVIKAKYLPQNKTILFKGFDSLNRCLESIRKILWYDKAREILIISKKNLSCILANKIDEKTIENLKNKCPEWMLVIGLEFNDLEKYHVDLADFKDFGVKFSENLNINNIKLKNVFLKEFELPDRLNNFRTFKKVLHIPFYINRDKILQLNNLIEKISIKYDYSFEDLLGYIMPIEQGHTYYMDYTIHYDKKSSDIEKVKKFYTELSKVILENGGVIDRPYGIWADLIFSKNLELFNFLKIVKNQLDPNNILNPGKLGL